MDNSRPVRIDDTIRAELMVLAGQLQATSGNRVSVSEAIAYLLRYHEAGEKFRRQEPPEEEK